MHSCERCKSYMVEGQVECAICGFDPTKVVEPEPEPVAALEQLAAAPVDGPIVFDRRAAGATPFLAVGALVVALVAFLMVTGSDVFGTGDELPQAGAEVAPDTTAFAAWNNDGDGEVGSGDAELVEAFVAACNNGRGVSDVTPYTRARGPHPVVIVDQRFDADFTTVDNELQRRVVPRQLSPAPLRDTELLLCADDAADPGVQTVLCPSDASSDPEELPLAGNDTEYRLVIAATGETVWSFSHVFPEVLVEQECPKNAQTAWGIERLQFPEGRIWPDVSTWAMSDGSPIVDEPAAEADEVDDAADEG